MISPYFKIPFRLDEILRGNSLPYSDLSESITSNLELIIFTRFGEHRSDPDFGCEIWDLDFELISSVTKWEEKLRKSLIVSITSHEPRLTNIEISATITDSEKFNIFKNFTEIKKRVDIVLTGMIHKTGEPFRFQTNLFLSPLSSD